MLCGFSVNNFRSFGEPRQYVGPLSKVNLIAGENNSGKSNILRFASKFLASKTPGGAGRSTISIPQGLDVPIGGTNDPPVIGLAGTANEMLDAASQQRALTDDERACLQAVFDQPAFHPNGDELVWVDYVIERQDVSQGTPMLSTNQLSAATAGLDGRVRVQLRDLSAKVANESGGADHDDMGRVIRRCTDVLETMPPVVTVEAIRSIDATTDNFAGFSGSGLIGGLARLERPSAANQADRQRFESINQFVRTVLAN